MDLISGFSAGLVFTLPLIPAAIGFYLALRCFKFPDLTVEGSFVFGLVITAYSIEKFDSYLPGFVLSCLGGAIFGSITGLLHVKLRVPSFASGIITSFFGTTLNYYILHKAFNSTDQIQEHNLPNHGLFEYFTYLDRKSDFIGQFSFYQILALTVICVTTLISVWLIVKSDFGRKLSMFGNNRSVAKIYTCNSDFFLVTGLAFTNLLVGFSGFLYSQIAQNADISQGSTILIPLLASVVIGEFTVNVFKKKNSIHYTAKPLLSRFFALSAAPFFGFLLYNVIVLIFSTLFLPGIESARNYYKYAISGLLILLIMIFNNKNSPSKEQDELI